MKFKIHLTPYDQFREGKLEAHENYTVGITHYFSNLFQKPQITITQNGRSAISILLEHLKLKREDEVWIITTFDYPNVSSCVTSTIFNYCKPSRVLTENTKLAFIIHEFGMVHPETADIIKRCHQRGISVVEDCAHTFLSKTTDELLAGQQGDWTIVSFPKFYPVEMGGLLAGKNQVKENSTFSIAIENDLRSVASHLSKTNQYAQRRADILKTILTKIQRMNLHSPLENRECEIIPWFFPIHVIQPEYCKNRLRQFGIETCVWHGSDLLCLPLHQYISDEEVEFMLATLLSVVSEMKN